MASRARSARWLLVGKFFASLEVRRRAGNTLRCSAYCLKASGALELIAHLYLRNMILLRATIPEGPAPHLTPTAWKKTRAFTENLSSSPAR